MYITQVFLDELVNVGIVGDYFVANIFNFISHWGSFDTAIINEWPGDFRDLILVDESNIFMEYCSSICPAL